ncbi:MAG: hypothetical protein AAGJ35_05620 [Myxococcota bacterium]
MAKAMKIATDLSEDIGSYIRIDLFSDGAGDVKVQEYATNHMGGYRYCAAKMNDDGCVDPCFMGTMWQELGGNALYGGLTTTMPSALDGWLDLSPSQQCDAVLATSVTADFDDSADCLTKDPGFGFDIPIDWPFPPFKFGTPTKTPSESPTAMPTTATPTMAPTNLPTVSPTDPEETNPPTAMPTMAPTSGPTDVPTNAPTTSPTLSPTAMPTASPTSGPTSSPTAAPTSSPTVGPTSGPTSSPTTSPTLSPTAMPTTSPTSAPTSFPITSSPTTSPTEQPSLSAAPSSFPTQCTTLEVSGKVFRDLDCNGKDDNEFFDGTTVHAFEQFTVSAYDNAGDHVQTVTVGKDGSYAFDPVCRKGLRIEFAVPDWLNQARETPMVQVYDGPTDQANLAVFNPNDDCCGTYPDVVLP